MDLKMYFLTPQLRLNAFHVVQSIVIMNSLSIKSLLLITQNNGNHNEFDNIFSYPSIEIKCISYCAIYYNFANTFSKIIFLKTRRKRYFIFVLVIKSFVTK